MAKQRISGQKHPGFQWGPFTTRIPIYHTRIEWPEFIQGLFVAGATSMALVPLLVSKFGLTFEEAITCSMIHTILISASPILFGEPFAAGWITPALPLTLAFVLGNYETTSERFQAMTAISLDLVAILFVLGFTGLGKKFIESLPRALKAGIIMGAAISALKRVFQDDIEKLLHQPISTTIALVVCLYITFSLPFQKLKRKYRRLAILASLGLLPGFLAAAFTGPIVGEITYNIEWGILIPPFASLWQKVSPFTIGWPTWQMFIECLPLAFIGYTILFGDLITGMEVLKEGQPYREDEKIDININRSHYSLGIRNFLMAISAPFFPTQGALWTGVHVIIVQRWKEGREKVDSIYSGISSYYILGLPILFVLIPVITGLRPLMNIALSITLVLTGFACAYVAMSIPKNPIEQGAVLFVGVCLTVFTPLVGLSVGIFITILLVGFKQESLPEMDEKKEIATEYD